MNRLESELINLFGRQVVIQSKGLKLEDVAKNAKLVAQGARQLIGATGKPDKQRAIIKTMAKGTAVALCWWIKEPDFLALYSNMISK